MNDMKTIVCGKCGKRFYVDRAQYEVRKYERICDACANNGGNDDIDSSDEFGQICQGISKFARSISRTIETIAESKENKNNKKQTFDEETKNDDND